MDKVKDMPLVLRVTPIPRMEPSDNDTLRNNERKQSGHQAMPATFSAQTSPDNHIARSISPEQPSVLVYDYDRRAQRIKLIRN